MIVLDFQPDPDVLKEDLETDILVQEFEVFLVTYFVFPVSFAVDETELLQLPPFIRVQGPQLARLPILHVATIGLDCVRQLRRLPTSSYSLSEYGDYLRFEKPNETVSIYSELNRKSATAHLAELLAAFDQFENKVKIFLRSNVPDLKHHRYWGKWLSNQR
jgi:hypothetical protein